MTPMLKFLFCLVFLSVIPVNALVQDTLKYARETAYKNDFTPADPILTLYNQESEDVYGLWLRRRWPDGWEISTALSASVKKLFL